MKVNYLKSDIFTVGLSVEEEEILQWAVEEFSTICLYMLDGNTL